MPVIKLGEACRAMGEGNVNARVPPDKLASKYGGSPYPTLGNSTIYIGTMEFVRAANQRSHRGPSFSCCWAQSPSTLWEDIGIGWRLSKFDTYLCYEPIIN